MKLLQDMETRNLRNNEDANFFELNRKNVKLEERETKVSFDVPPVLSDNREGRKKLSDEDRLRQSDMLQKLVSSKANKEFTGQNAFAATSTLRVRDIPEQRRMPSAERISVATAPKIAATPMSIVNYGRVPMSVGTRRGSIPNSVATGRGVAPMSVSSMKGSVQYDPYEGIQLPTFDGPRIEQNIDEQSEFNDTTSYMGYYAGAGLNFKQIQSLQDKLDDFKKHKIPPTPIGKNKSRTGRKYNEKALSRMGEKAHEYQHGMGDMGDTYDEDNDDAMSIVSRVTRLRDKTGVEKFRNVESKNQYENIDSRQQAESVKNFSNLFPIDPNSTPDDLHVIGPTGIPVEDKFLTFVFSPYCTAYIPPNVPYIDLSSEANKNAPGTNHITLKFEVTSIKEIVDLAATGKKEAFKRIKAMLNFEFQQYEAYITQFFAELIEATPNITPEIRNGIEINMSRSLTAVAQYIFRNTESFDLGIYFIAAQFLSLGVSVDEFFNLAARSSWIRAVLGANNVGVGVRNMTVYLRHGVLQINDAKGKVIGYTFLDAVDAIQNDPDLANYVYHHGQISPSYRFEINRLIEVLNQSQGTLL